eukprot:355958-Chlamydomonas_euryale.AAC.2
MHHICASWTLFREALSNPCPPPHTCIPTSPCPTCTPAHVPPHAPLHMLLHTRPCTCSFMRASAHASSTHAHAHAPGAFNSAR